ncbi:unnamed protein product [Ectocarpus sp. CCAP 1310/34]|nr:unnamed protein product [Ectocarpus sp. CCAP 1310/34]
MASFLSMAADCGPTAEEHVRNMRGPFGMAREDTRHGTMPAASPASSALTAKATNKCVTHNGQQNQRVAHPEQKDTHTATTHTKKHQPPRRVHTDS